MLNSSINDNINYSSLRLLRIEVENEFNAMGACDIDPFESLYIRRPLAGLYLPFDEFDELEPIN